MFKYKQVKIATTTIGVILLLFGFFGFFIAAGTRMSDKTGKLFNQKPLYTINGIAVDSIGNIYYGNKEHTSIDVYDNKGSFLYRFSFPSGYFVFHIDHEDIVHVATARVNKIFSFKDGDLLSERKYINSQEKSDIINEFNRQRKRKYIDSNGNKYVISVITIKVYDQQGTLIRRVWANAPIWPFPIVMFWCIAAFGLFIAFISNLEFLWGLFGNSRSWRL